MQKKIIRHDPIEKPSHYVTGDYECFDVMQETEGEEAVKNFCKCNAFKYLYRSKRKNGLEDIKKAIWYLKKYVELSERRQTDDDKSISTVSKQNDES